MLKKQFINRKIQNIIKIKNSLLFKKLKFLILKLSNRNITGIKIENIFIIEDPANKLNGSKLIKFNFDKLPRFLKDNKQLYENWLE